ncbi:pectinesterase family protein [Paenibacillus sp. TRM 82003]|nr:pectinesterase family protein [Paenibacillus sp. TRM 82003]
MSEERYRDCVVAADGSGDYATVGEAIAAAPSGATSPFVIYIKRGTYKEKLIIGEEKSNLALIGEDRKGTLLTFDDYAGVERPAGYRLSNTEIPSVYVTASDFYAENLTFENTAGTIAQALALYAHGDRTIFRHVDFLGWQDTLRVEGPDKRQYFYDCYIEGHVDYIYGSGTAVFDRCAIHSKAVGYITASSAPATVRHGMVFLDCVLTGDAPPGTVYLGRPWRDYAATMFVNCRMDEAIHPSGWHNWEKPECEWTSRYGEYGSVGPGANDATRVGWAKQLSEESAKRLTAERVLGGDDQWNPTTLAVIAPEGRTV